MEAFFEYLDRQGGRRIVVPENGINAFLIESEKKPYVICFLDADNIYKPDREHYMYIRGRLLEAVMNEMSVQPEILFIIMSADINHVRQAASDIGSYWLINKNTRRLIIYDAQPYDFQNIRAALEAYLESGNILEGSRKSTRAVSETRYSGETRFIMTYVIIIMNVLVYIITASRGNVESAEYILECGGVYAEAIKDGEIYRFFTAMFLHYGFMHLTYNMIFIFAFGRSIETYLGKVAFTLIYIISGLAGNVCAYFYNMESSYYAVTAGASGAAYALLGSFVVLTFSDKRHRDQNPAFLLIFVAASILDGLQNDDIANAAHIGGLVAGFVLTLAYVAVKSVFLKKSEGK